MTPTPRPWTVTMPDGFGLGVHSSGREDGPPLLLLAGQANSHHWWDGLREDFEETHWVLTVDQRGTGASRGPVGSWTTELFAEDAAAALSGLGVTRASVYGTSMGGRVAQVLAARHPSLVDRLVLACTSPGGRHAQERSREVRRSLMDANQERRRAALYQLFYTDAWWTRESNLLGDPTMTAPEALAHLRASNTHDAWDLLPQIIAPTLVLHGTDDQMAPVSNAAVLADRIPHARLHLVDGGRHGFFEEFRDQIVPRIHDLLG